MLSVSLPAQLGSEITKSSDADQVWQSGVEKGRISALMCL